MITLVHESTGKPVQVGETLRSFRGDDWVVTGWSEPHHAGSTGRIHVKRDEWKQSFFPSVFNCEWRETI